MEIQGKKMHPKNQFLPFGLPFGLPFELSHFLPSPPPSDQESDSNSSSSSSSRRASVSISNSLAAFGFPLAPPSVNPTKALDIDVGTPDAHVPRDPRLIRLTGVHPFNVEAPLSDLFNSGFLTPPELFYVRNHGAVPHVQDEEIPQWDVTIEGLVERPITLSFAQLSSPKAFEQCTLPVTLVCAGNRRKEQNQVRKSQGFSWGPAGVSTALFTGPMLSDVLSFAKPLRRKGAKYVCFEGADKLPNGYYGTSVKLSWAMDPQKGIMLAHKMNGEMLRPDHGKPIRVVAPGMIGGRSVKWLKRIIITDSPSTNWYHIYDNRVLPTMVTPEIAKGEEGKKWWTDERYAIYDLNVNSAIVYPAHEESFELTAPKTKVYKVRGYAYGGGGRRITRVEVSLDKGSTWRLASILYPEDKYRESHVPENLSLYGGRLDMLWRDTCFCWCFWDIDIPHTDFADPKTSDIVVRAMDEGMNVQPRDMYWSVLGMMNNPWFRIAIHKQETTSGNISIRFEHPTQPALKPGGWMERVKKAGGDLLDGNWGEALANSDGSQITQPKAKEKKLEIKMTNESVKRIIEFEEFKAHTSKEKGSWFAVEGEVYDATEFMSSHPGGEQSIISAGGTDCTEEFVAIHSETAKLMMPKYHIGTLSPSAVKALTADSSSSNTSRDELRPTFLSPREWLPSRLLSKISISPDTRIFTFSLDHPTQNLGLPIGQHLMVKLQLPDGEVVIRAYTPISDSEIEFGSFRLLVKIYEDEGAEGRRGGKMSRGLDKLEIESTVLLKGPVGKFEYLVGTNDASPFAVPHVTLSGKQRKISRFLMVAAGTGITPIYQVLRAVVGDLKRWKGFNVKCFVLYGNRREEDVLCGQELEEMVREAGEDVRLVCTLSAGRESWEGRRGRIDREMFKEGVEWLSREVPEEVEMGEMMVLACGPKGLEEGVKRWVGEWKLEDSLCVF